MFWVRATDHPASHCENLHVTCGRVGSWKEFLVLWLKNRQMFSEGTNTVHGVIASSGTGQAVVLACLTKDKPCPDYFKLATVEFWSHLPTKFYQIFSCLAAWIQESNKRWSWCLLRSYLQTTGTNPFCQISCLWTVEEKCNCTWYFFSLLMVCYVAWGIDAYPAAMLSYFCKQIKYSTVP